MAEHPSVRRAECCSMTCTGWKSSMSGGTWDPVRRQDCGGGSQSAARTRVGSQGQDRGGSAIPVSRVAAASASSQASAHQSGSFSEFARLGV